MKKGGRGIWDPENWRRLDVAVCEFRLITEPPPACRTGPQPTAEPFRHAGRDVPLHRHPIPCRPPMLATIELNRTRAFPCTVTSVLDSAADNRGTFRRVRAPRCGFHAGLGCNGEFSVYASHLRLRASLVRGFRWTATTAGPGSQPGLHPWKGRQVGQHRSLPGTRPSGVPPSP